MLQMSVPKGKYNILRSTALKGREHGKRRILSLGCGKVWG